MFKKKPPLPTQVQFFLRAAGEIEYDGDNQDFEATIEFTPWVSVDGEDSEVNWSAFQWNFVPLFFTPPGHKRKAEFDIDSDTRKVIDTFRTPWRFTLETETIEDAGEQLATEFRERYDEHMATLTLQDTFREVVFPEKLSQGLITLKPHGRGYGD